MRLLHYTFLTLLFASLFPLAAPGALAFSPDEPLPDSEQEARAQVLHTELRCMVCQGQSIADSNAELARDMRVIVRERIAAGATDEEVVGFLTKRYGDYVLLKPPIKPTTYALWFGPALILVAGAAVLYFIFRRRTDKSRLVASTNSPLSQEEQRKLDSILKDDM